MEKDEYTIVQGHHRARALKYSGVKLNRRIFWMQKITESVRNSIKNIFRRRTDARNKKRI